MAYVYQNIIIGDRLDVKVGGQVITTTKGDLITDDGTSTIRLPVGTDGQALVANSVAASGLAWTTLTPGDFGLIAGNGLVLTGNTLDVVGSATILSNPDNVEINSSAVANQVILSAGTVGTAATYGALPLADANAVAGTLPIANGGTGTAAFTTGNRVVITNAGNTALETSTLDPTLIVTTTGTQTLTNKTLVSPIIQTSINDTNGNEIIALTPTAAAVNEITISNAATGTGPTIEATGSDADVDLNLDAKGTGNVVISSIAFPNTDGTVGQVLATNGAGELTFVNVETSLIGTVTTTDATPTIIPGVDIITIPSTVYLVEAKYVAKNSAGGPTDSSASFIIKSTIDTIAVPGSATIIGTDLIYTPVDTVWEAAIIVSGTTIQFQVTGAAATTINWKVSYSIVSV